MIRSVFAHMLWNRICVHTCSMYMAWVYVNITMCFHDYLIILSFSSFSLSASFDL